MDVVSNLFKKRKKPDEVVALVKQDLVEIADNADEKTVKAVSRLMRRRSPTSPRGVAGSIRAQRPGAYLSRAGISTLPHILRQLVLLYRT